MKRVGAGKGARPRDSAHAPAKERPRRRRGDPLLRAEKPTAPEWAKWEVFAWSAAMCNWQHLEFARTRKDCQRAARETLAMGGKVLFKKLAASGSPGGADGGPTAERAGHGGVEGERRAVRADGRRPSTDSDAYRKASIASLVHWLDVAERAELIYHMPHAEIRSLRDKCRRILEGRISRRSPDFDEDPLRRWL